MALDYELIFGIDKQAHLYSWGAISIILGMVIVLISNNQTVKRNISYMWIILITIGVADEYRQYLLPNRSAEVLDAIANALGVTIGLTLPLLILYVIKYRSHFLIKLFALYSIILVPLLLGLIYINEVPFIVLEEPEQVHDIFVKIIAYTRR